MRKEWIALLIALLPSIAAVVMHPFRGVTGEDFRVYYTASYLAREHRGAAIYSGADTGVDPQVRSADPATEFAHTGDALGIPGVRLYVYPPVLADCLIPLTLTSVNAATRWWTLINVAATLFAVGLISRLLKIKLFGAGSILLCIAVFASEPFLVCISAGQVTILLLLLWICGTMLYLNNRATSSAFLFAWAGVLKLTPFIVLVPFLIWREWKWLRAYAASLLIFFLGMCAFNTPAALKDYFFHVMPPMSKGIAFVTNETILCVTQVAYFALHGVVLSPLAMAIPGWLVITGKVASMVALAAAILPVFRLGAKMRLADRALTLALFAALSAPIAPVSFRYAYMLAALALAILWNEALSERIASAQLVLLTLCTLALTSNLFEKMMSTLGQREQFKAPATLLMLFLPLSMVLLVIVRLTRMRPVVAQMEAPAVLRENGAAVPA